MLRYLCFGLSVVMLAQAAESSNHKISSKQGHVSVDADGEVHNVKIEHSDHDGPAEKLEKKAENIEKKDVSKLAAGFHVRTSATEKPVKNKGVKEHKPVALAEKTVRADAAAPTEDVAAKENAKEEAVAAAPGGEAPAAAQGQAPEKQDEKAKEQQGEPSPSPAQSKPQQVVQGDPGAQTEKEEFVAKVFVVVTLVVAMLIICFILRDRLIEALPGPIQDAICSVKQSFGMETSLSSSRPAGPRKPVPSTRSESSEEYSSLRAAGYSDQHEYLSPVQSESSSTSEEVPAGKA